MRNWKYHLPLNETYPRWTSASQTGPGREAKLVNLSRDIQEQNNVATQHPEIVRQMELLAQLAIKTLGDNGQPGSEQRFSRTLQSSKPMTLSSAK